MGTETVLEVLTIRRDSPTVVVTLLKACVITVVVEEPGGHAGAPCTTTAAISTARTKLDPADGIVTATRVGARCAVWQWVMQIQVQAIMRLC